MKIAAIMILPSSHSPSVKKPAAVVKSQFCKLDSEHIRFVLDSMNENTSRVRNIRKYLLSVLYNASMTIGNYYSALVNHDLYGGG